MKNTLNRIGNNTPLTAIFATFSSVIPTNIVFHAANAIGTSNNVAESAAQFTAVASAATIAALLIKNAAKSNVDEPPTPS
ncbi:hypothetical protein [uncultured Tateyamaria sp.]|uniref:hypothetical protein n=1 Tax=uncultured Tateyamaria sp. TaxID=455651 RepID=UPI00260C449F|nr:hypothetical protein [uncultured Tateyamaria sp.]